MTTRQSKSHRRLRPARKASGLCVLCGKPALVKVILDSKGCDVERKVMTRCGDCRVKRKP